MDDRHKKYEGVVRVGMRQLVEYNGNHTRRDAAESYVLVEAR